MNNKSKESKLEERPTKRVKRLAINQAGPLYIDDKYKKPGMVTRIVDADRPGRIAYLQKLGYSIVSDPDLQVGDQTVKSTSRLDSAVTIELGGAHGHRNGVLMEIPEEIYKEIQEEKEEINKELDASLGKTNIPTQFGEIVIGGKTIK